jgi:hypothetical protein
MWLRDAACHGLLNPAVQGLVLAQHLFRVAIPAEAEAALARSWRIRYMVTRAEATYAAILDREHKSDGPSHPLQLGRRLYRMCLSGRPRYLFTEFRDGLKAALSIRRRRNVALPS